MNPKTPEQQEIDRIAEKFIREEIHAHVSSWADASFKAEIFSYDDIENLYEEPGEENEDGDTEMKEIFQWFMVSPFLYEDLKEINEPVINNNYGYFWGRTCFGQSLELDGTFQEIAKRLIERTCEKALKNFDERNAS